MNEKYARIVQGIGTVQEQVERRHIGDDMVNRIWHRQAGQLEGPVGVDMRPRASPAILSLWIK